MMADTVVLNRFRVPLQPYPSEGIGCRYCGKLCPDLKVTFYDAQERPYCSLDCAANAFRVFPCQIKVNPFRAYWHAVDRCGCGRKMIPAGRGAYPYPCITQDKYPDAMIYSGCEGGCAVWTADTPDVREAIQLEREV